MNGNIKYYFVFDDMTRLYCVSDNESLQRLLGMGHCMNTSLFYAQIVLISNGTILYL